MRRKGKPSVHPPLQQAYGFLQERAGKCMNPGKEVKKDETSVSSFVVHPEQFLVSETSHCIGSNPFTSSE